ncbi:FtsJ-like methyltransferase [Fragilaria crotonensis]|nr:FtsJ-like methyltransferase [Fragilaria crotonensis]
MTSTAPNVSCLPAQTFAIMVHKLYVDRVKDYLSREGGWNDPLPSPLSVKILHTQEISGVSRSRRGFVLLLIEKVNRPVESLPPMARQNISWIGRISHQSEDRGLIWRTLRHQGFQPTNNSLRVDVFPREKTDLICLTLQESCAEELSQPQPSDPFEGPISMTMSASKCSHRLTVICTGTSTFLWGLASRQSNRDSAMFNLKFNHEAADEIVVEPADSNTGKDVMRNVEITTPLSRAYYKLDQVWHDYLENDPMLELNLGTAIDLGACPGGWTQVLVHKLGLSSVVAVDPGRPADRILNLPQVVHVQSSIKSTDIAPYGPFTILVCDASDVWKEIMNQIAATVVGKSKWMLPSVCVITLKLPFKTLQSIQRHVDMMAESIPSHLDDMAEKMFPTEDRVRVRYQIVHLMANSDSERTLIAIFHKQSSHVQT